MNSIELFFSKNLTQIWTIISVIVGGLITYFSTLHIESKKMKMNKRSESATNVVIPCVLCLRDTRNKLISLRDKINHSNDIDLSKELQFLKEPLEFLNDERNYFIPKYLRQNLVLYRKKIKDFSDTLNKDCNYCIGKYSNYISRKLDRYLFNNADCIADTTFSCEIRNNIKLMLVRNRFFSLKNTLEKVNFFINHSDNNSGVSQHYINLDKSTRDEIESIRYAFENGIDVLEDSKKYREERRAIDPYYTDYCYDEEEKYDIRLRESMDLLDYLYSSAFDDESELFYNLKDNLSSHSKFNSLIPFINNIINIFNDYIDSIFYND